MFKKSYFLTILFCSFCLSLTSLNATAASSLGIGVKPIPKNNTQDSAKLSNNTNLWFVVKQGESSSRDVLFIGSKVDQRVNLEIITAVDNNGTLSPGNEPSALAKLVKFSDNNFLLKANQNKVITVNLEIPIDTESQALNGYLAVNVAASNSTSKFDKNNSKIKAIVKTQIRTLLRIFVGIGSYKDFFTDLSIEDVRDYSIGGSKFLDVIIKNIGKTPITPTGDVSFSSLDFAGLRFGPISYLTLTMEPGKTYKFKMRVPNEIQPGNWQILVKAQQGNIIRTRIFEKNIKFREGINWLLILLRILSVIISLYLFYFLKRNFNIARKSSIVGNLAQEEKQSFFEKFRAKKRSGRNKKKGNTFDEELSFNFLLDELNLEDIKKPAGKKPAGKRS